MSEHLERAAKACILMFEGSLNPDEDWERYDDTDKQDVLHAAKVIVEAFIGDEPVYRICEKCDGSGSYVIEGEEPDYDRCELCGAGGYVKVVVSDE